MNKRIVKLIFLINILMIAAITRSFAQNDSAAIAAADTTNFSVNSAGGWQLFNSYVAAYNTDSVQLELIIQHANNIDWNQEQYAGKVKTTALIPAQEQTISFSLITNQYLLRIDVQGKCYLRLFSGSAPADDPAVIPVKVIYKK